MSEDEVEKPHQVNVAAVTGFTEQRNALKDTHAEFVEACNRHLKDMDVEDGPCAFRFPYIDEKSGEVELADGIMEQEKITIGGHAYEIDAPGPIKLKKIKFVGGYMGQTHMEGAMWGIIPSPVATKVSTADLYTYLDVLRKGIPVGTSKRIPTPYGDVELTALS